MSLEIARDKLYISIAAVEIEGLSYGVVRTTGKAKGTRHIGIQGISGFFGLDSSDNKLWVGTGNSFFYGTKNNLKRSYNGRVPILNLEQYLNRNSKTTDYDRSSFLIPLGDLKLSDSRSELVEIIFSIVGERLPFWLEGMKKTDISAEEDNAMKSFHRLFSSFPCSLKEDAKNLGSYLSSSGYINYLTPKTDAEPNHGLTDKLPKDLPAWILESKAFQHAR